MEEQKQKKIGVLPKSEFAGFWIRTAAFAVDFLVLILISVITAIIFVIIMKIARINFNIEVISSFVGFLINAGYYVFMTYRYGATFGKKFFGLKVESCDDEKLDIGAVLVREVAGKFLSTMLLGLGYVWIFFDKEKQGLHDKLAKTVVLIEEKNKVAKWKVAITAGVFIIFSICFSVWIMLGTLDEEFQAGIDRTNVILAIKKTSVSAKLCISEGNSLTNPKNNQQGGGDICSEKIGLDWPKLGGGYEYGKISREHIYIKKDGLADVKCEIASGECELE